MQNTNNELVSVIVPVYKVEPYLDRCVASILAQTYPNLEVILVDDGSPDNCPASMSPVQCNLKEHPLPYRSFPNLYPLSF